jgi:hypothetical protein
MVLSIAHCWDAQHCPADIGTTDYQHAVNAISKSKRIVQ